METTMMDINDNLIEKSRMYNPHTRLDCVKLKIGLINPHIALKFIKLFTTRPRKVEQDLRSAVYSEWKKTHQYFANEFLNSAILSHLCIWLKV